MQPETTARKPRGGAPVPSPVPAGLALFFRGNVVRRESEDRRLACKSRGGGGEGGGVRKGQTVVIGGS